MARPRRMYCTTPYPHVHVHGRQRIFHAGHRPQHTTRSTTHIWNRWTTYSPGWMLLGLLILAALVLPDIWCLLIRLSGFLVLGGILYFGWKWMFGRSHGRR